MDIIFRLMKLTWLGHSAFRLDFGTVVYIDPYNADESHDADMVLVSHGHYDHCDPKSIKAVSKEDTVVMCPHSCVSKVHGNAHGLGEGDSIAIGAVKVEATAAYNTNKPNHPTGSGIGYIVESQGKRVYHAGDTDLIPQMKELGPIDVALLPVGGSFTMDWAEAAEAVKWISPVTAIPMHYGEVVGTLQDAVRFRNKVNAETKTKAVIPKPGETMEI